MMEEGYPPPQSPMQGYDPSRNYFNSSLDSSTGFKYRVDGGEIVKKTIDELRGGLYKDKNGRNQYRKEFQMMNDLGIARASFFLNGIVNKNTHLSRFRDEARILRQIQALSREWCVTQAINRQRWEIKESDLVQQIMEGSILMAMLRADEGFEAGLSSKSHHVMESYNHSPVQEQSRGLFSRINPFNWGR